MLFPLILTEAVEKLMELFQESVLRIIITNYHVCCLEKVFFICDGKLKNGKHILSDEEVFQYIFNYQKRDYFNIRFSNYFSN